MIKLQNVHKKYGSQHVLNGIDLEVDRGVFCGISGRSGAGKSTLLKLISGIERPDEGSVTLDGRSLDKYSVPDIWGSRFSFVFQNYFLLDDRSVEGNLRLADRRADRRKMAEVLEKVGLAEDVLNRKVPELSGGEKQRAGIARALLKPFDILIADEPTGNLDRQNARAVREIMRRLSDEGKTVIVVSHDDGFLNVADRRLLLEDGRLKSV